MRSELYPRIPKEKNHEIILENRQRQLQKFFEYSLEKNIVMHLMGYERYIIL